MQVQFQEIYIKGLCYDLTISFEWQYMGFNFIDEAVGWQHDYSITMLLLDSVRQYVESEDDFNECIVLSPKQRYDIRDWVIDELLNNKEKYGIVHKTKQDHE